MMNLARWTVFWMLACTFAACKHQEKTGGGTVGTRTEGYRETAEQRYGARSFECTSNGSGTLVLCTKIDRGKPVDPALLTRFFVFDVKDNRVVFEDSIRHSGVSWYNNTQLRIYEGSDILPGINDKPVIRIFDLEKMKWMEYEEKKD